jgi:hypothetical protein
MKWLVQIIIGVFCGMFRYVFDKIVKRANEPTTIQDAQTPPDIARANRAALDQWMREHPGCNDPK